ncbi:MAG: peroxidase [Planctomycetota bacterium]
MAWIHQTSDAEATGLIAKIFEDARKRAGKVWNIVRLTSINGRMTRAHLGLYSSVMKTDSSLSPRVRETLAVVVSRANDCHY